VALNDVETKVVYVFPRGRRHVWVAEGLRRDIMLGDIEPGATLVELEVGARFQCSQSTAREALMLLQEEGLVQRSGHRGTRVSAWTEDEALEMLRLRRDMECRAAQRLFTKPARRTSDLVPALRAHLASMEAAAAADDEYALAQVDREFHLRLFSEAKLPSVEPLLLRCLIHNHRYKMLNSRDRHDLHHAAQRHVVIIEAVERRDTAGLVAALEHHISTIFEEGLLLLEEK
jgi:DNA-binding GntR family transcriptional regulator